MTNDELITTLRDFFQKREHEGNEKAAWLELRRCETAKIKEAEKVIADIDNEIAACDMRDRQLIESIRQLLRRWTWTCKEKIALLLQTRNEWTNWEIAEYVSNPQDTIATVLNLLGAYSRRTGIYRRS